MEQTTLYASLDIGKQLRKIQVIITEAQNSNSTTNTKNMYYCGTLPALLKGLDRQLKGIVQIHAVR